MKLILIILLTSLLSGFMMQPFSEASADAFSVKMSYYFDTPTNYQMRHFDNGWWSATLATGNPLSCTDTVYLSTRWRGSKSPLWKYTLVHEWVHVSHRASCVNNERATRLEAFRILARAREWGAFIVSVNHFMALGNLSMKEVVQIIKEEYRERGVKNAR